METADTLPKLLKYNCEKYGDTKVAMRVKRFGFWQEYSWKAYYENVKYLSLGLVSLGLKAGDVVSILGENKPEAYWTELATQAAGGIALGIFTDCMPNEVKFFVQHSDSKFVIAGDQEQVDKMLQIKDDLPLLKKVIYWDPKGVWNYDDPILTSFNNLLELGREYEKSHPEAFDANVERGKGSDIAVICYTSGTTGLPKGAMLSHSALIQNEHALSSIDRYRPGDEIVSFVPLAWVTDQYMGVTGPLYCQLVVNFPEKPETVQENIREIGAQILFWGPRNWESVNRLIQAKMIDTTPLKRFMYNLFLPAGYKVADSKMAGKKPSPLWRFLNFLAYWALFRNLKDKVGLAKVRVATTAAAPISPDVIRYFQAIGVNIKQIYGGSEHGLVTATRDDDIRPETTGPPSLGVDIRLSDEGEILIRGGCMFSGYYKNPEGDVVSVRNGWYFTGDFGHINEDGHLIVMDRMNDLRELKGGRKFSPQYAEIRLRFSPYIKDVLTVGGGDKDFVTCVVNIDLDNAGRWAEARRIPYTTFTDLSQKPEVIDLIKKDIQRVNKTLPEFARIKRFANLHREFDADEAELTRTRKIKRTFVEERYKDLIDALYGEVGELAVEAPITYRDGRKGTIKTAIKVNSLE
ncbi:MAG: long-chain fatty acid--CoA ligase [Chloroflexi bacterium]|nr:long-chain fatty acid--CoA ligase [Chloroflexota bacterium]